MAKISFKPLGRPRARGTHRAGRSDRRRYRSSRDREGKTPAGQESLAAGPGDRNDKGERVAMDVKVGDMVLFAKYSGTEVKIDGKKLLIMRESDLLAL